MQLSKKINTIYFGDRVKRQSIVNGVFDKSLAMAKQNGVLTGVLRDQIEDARAEALTKLERQISKFYGDNNKYHADGRLKESV
jgi:hypothetical protein